MPRSCRSGAGRFAGVEPDELADGCAGRWCQAGFLGLIEAAHGCEEVLAMGDVLAEGCQEVGLAGHWAPCGLELSMKKRPGIAPQGAGWGGVAVALRIWSIV